MITLQGSMVVPQSYLGLYQMVPLDPSDVQGKIEIPYEFGSFSESRGIYRENDVHHVKVEGLITSSSNMGIVQAPTTRHPHRVLLPGNIESRYGISGECVGHDDYGSPQTVYISYKDGDYYYDMRFYSVLRSSGKCNTRFGYRYKEISRTETSILLEYWTATSVSTVYIDCESFGSCKSKAITSGWKAGTNQSKTIFNVVGSTSQSELVAAVDNAVAELLLAPVSIETTHWGILAHEATQRLNATSINMLEFISDLRHPTRLIPKLRNLRFLKEWAGGYLAVQFGVLPTISDITEIVAAVRRSRKRLKNSPFRFAFAGEESSESVGDVTIRIIQHLKLAVDANDKALSSISAKLDSVGFLPKLSNIWDLIPLSFAVDWLVNIGDFLSRWESKTLIEEFAVSYTVRSVKTVRSIRINEPGKFSGEVSLVDYRRWVTFGCPVPPLSLSIQSLDQSHWLEAGALFVQRSK